MNCRICGSDLQSVYDFGDQPLPNGFDRSDERHPLHLGRCTVCKLYQLLDTIPPDTLFSGYVYRSGAGGMQQKLFADLVKQSSRFLRRGDVVVDIGCNDGALLAEFAKLGVHTVGVEPYPTADYKPNCSFSWDAHAAELIAHECGQAKIITATNAWAHIDDLHQAAKGISLLLARDGRFVIQVPWIRDLLNNNLYDTIYHEHLSYFGVKQLNILFHQHDLAVLHVDYLPTIHGGTIRCWIGRGEPDASVDYMKLMEKSQTSPEHFGDLVNAHIVTLWEVLDNDYWTVYGCSAKATMLLNISGAAHLVTEAVDDTPEKQGKTLPGTKVKIGKHATSGKILLTAWNYADVIKEKLAKTGWHGTICVPMPVPRIEYV